MKRPPFRRPAMLILRDVKALFQADDPWLRALLARRTSACSSS
jgi:hypothetical protein